MEKRGGEEKKSSTINEIHKLCSQMVAYCSHTPLIIALFANTTSRKEEKGGGSRKN